MFAFEVLKHPPTFSTVFTVKATRKFKQDCKKMIIMEQDYSQVLWSQHIAYLYVGYMESCFF